MDKNTPAIPKQHTHCRVICEGGNTGLGAEKSPKLICCLTAAIATHAKAAYRPDVEINSLLQVQGQGEAKRTIMRFGMCATAQCELVRHALFKTTTKTQAKIHNHLDAKPGWMCP